MSEDRKLPKLPTPTNGAIGAPHTQPRRQTDEPGSDYRYVRAYSNGHGGHGPPSIPVTVLIGVIISVVGTIGTLITFGQTQIDRAIDPLQSAHGRLDDLVSREIRRLDAEKVDNAISLQVAAEMNRRLTAIERILELQSERPVILQQSLLDDLRQRIGKLEANGDPDYDGSR